VSISRPAGANRRPVDRFHADGAGSVSQGRLLVLLYERLLRDLDDAVVGMAARDRDRSHRSLIHAQDIVAELDLALDRERWPGAEAQSAIYQWLLAELIRANIDCDDVRVRQCRAVVAPLAETWDEAWRTTSGGPTAAVAASVGLGAAEADRASLDVVG
jgi:flagellar secretion chaperone FliS